MSIPIIPESQSMEQTEVGNKQIILKNYTDQIPKETDLELRHGNKIKLKVPKGSGAFLVKNLYLSCDPYMRGRMRDFHDSYLPPFTPGSVCNFPLSPFYHSFISVFLPLFDNLGMLMLKVIEGFGVSRVVDSDNPNFKPGDLIAGVTGWEEYSLIYRTQQLRKIQHQDDIPLSFHVGLLGMQFFYPSTSK